ncbi:DUF7529 family protein [Haloarchaeobius sp. DFWS5]|uniref:DUF7529 family protein n=1 Tax=Haloarchaeobius sp. DFWS5 TaxID=3446114 RepID=UPI003EC12C8F
MEDETPPDVADVERLADRVVPVWEQVVEDMEATAEEYREEGWAAIECHPGDVAAVADDIGRTGLDVLLPDNEFDDVQAAYEAEGAFDEVEVFRAEEGGVVFAVAALLNRTTETALLVPLYYDTTSSQEFLQLVKEEGELRVHLRPLDQREVITFTQQNPELFLPGDDDEE